MKAIGLAQPAAAAPNQRLLLTRNDQQKQY